MNPPHLIGIDIGGTKICACLGDATGKIFTSRKISTQPLSSFQRGFEAICELIGSMLKEQKLHIDQISAIGLSAPGPLSTREGKMLTPPNLPGWKGAPLLSFFEKTFRKPTLLNTDAKAAALAEYQFGSSKGTPHLVYLTCSTGMGGGAIVNGQLVQGISDTATEVGHYVLDLGGPACPCGLNGCFEVYCGGAALAKKMQSEIRARHIATQILAEAGGEIDQIDAASLIRAVRKKDPYALKIWDEFCLRLAQGIGVVLMNFNPEVVILGTLAIHSGSLLLDPVNHYLPRFAWKENIQACRLEASSLGERISELSGLALAKEAHAQAFNNRSYR